MQNARKTDRCAWVFWVGFALIILAGLYLRFYDLSLRPVHNDEGVNYHFSKEVRTKGYYPYSHENYHGPTYFYLLAYVLACFDDTEIALRALTALFGGLLPLLLLPLMRSEGRTFLIIASLFTAISPSLVFYSRYAIHEVLFLFFSTSFAISILLWCKKFEADKFYWAAIALALLVATKETFIILCASLVLAMLATISPLTIVREFYKSRHHIFYSFLIFIFILFAIMSGGFQSFQTLHEMFLAVPQWVARNEADYGHHKPFWSYIQKMIWVTELHLLIPLAVLPLATIGFSFRKGRYVFQEKFQGVRFISVWAISTTLIYAAVKYKTPWLEINFVFPLILLFAWTISRCVPYLALQFAIVLVFTVPTIASTLKYNFHSIGIGSVEYSLKGAIPYGPANPFSYVQTSDGMVLLVSDIESYWKKNPDSKVLVGCAQYWPLPYYLRNAAHNVAYLTTDKPAAYIDQYDIIIVGQNDILEKSGWVKKYYRLSDVQESNTYFKVK